MLTPILALERAETAKRTLGIAKKVLRFSQTNGWLSQLPTEGFEDLVRLHRKKPRPMPSLTKPEDFGRLLKDIDNYEGSIVTRLALQLIPLVTLRPGKEFRMAK